jgi:hypothetical protein
MWAYALLAGAQLIGGYQQADAIKGSADVQQSINNLNANYQELDAFNAQKAGYSQAARYQTVVDSTIAKQRVDEAAGGQAVGYGTAATAEGDSKLTGMLNVMEIQRQARESAHGYQVQAINTRLGGQMTQLQAGMDASAAENRGFTSALSTGVSGYERLQSTGSGVTSKSGSNSSPRWRQASSYTDASKPGGYGSSTSPAWFFGSNPSPYSQPSQSSSLFSDSDWKF